MRSMTFSTLIWLFAFAASATAQRWSIGRCPEVKILESFDMTEFLGVWYEQSSYPTGLNFALKCINTNFWADTNNTVHVHYKAHIKLINTKFNMNMTVRTVEPGQLYISADENSNASKEPNLLVLGTDYNNYAALYTCTSFTKMFHATAAYILTRERKTEKGPVIEARKVLEDNKITALHLHTVNQVDCDDESSENSKDAQ